MNYQEWIKTDSYLYDKLSDIIMVNGIQERYSQMTPFGIKIWTDYRITMNPFKNPIERFTLYDLNLSFDKFENKVREFNGRMQVFYSEDGYGTPVFDNEEDAYNFIEWYSMNNKKEVKMEYYYQTPHSYDYKYEDYLEYCENMEIQDKDVAPDGSDAFYRWCESQIDWYTEIECMKQQFAIMVKDIIGKDDISIDEINDMYFYVKSEAVGWRRKPAHSTPKRVDEVSSLMFNAYESISMFSNVDEDGKKEYGIILSGHDSTDYFNVVPFHEDFIVEIMDDMAGDMDIENIVSYIGYYDFTDIRNMVSMVENIGSYDEDGMEFIINNLVDGSDKEMLLELLYGVEDE